MNKKIVRIESHSLVVLDLFEGSPNPGLNGLSTFPLEKYSGDGCPGFLELILIMWRGRGGGARPWDAGARVIGVMGGVEKNGAIELVVSSSRLSLSLTRNRAGCAG